MYFYSVNFEFSTVRELSEDEKMMIILSEDFQRFVDRTGRIMERALSEAVDICTDYTGTADADDVGLVYIFNYFFHLHSVCWKLIFSPFIHSID